ncbi:MAG TPA: HAMP domain-containing sensor histidine kinase [Vicinamibacterales bacterium]
MTKEAQDPQPPQPPQDPQHVLGVAAHEIKNLLGPLAMTLQLCERRAVTGEPVAAEDLAFAREQVRRLSKLVNDLLDTTQVSSDQFPLQRTTVDLVALVQNSVETFRRAHTRRIVIEVPTEPLSISGDPERLGAVLANYLDNAVKYTPEPSLIEVRLNRAGERVRIAVTDHGPGIPTGSQTHLFQRYFRAPETAEQSRGLGLGLFLSRVIAERHGGAVGLSSVPGKGTTFWLDLPLGQG